MFVEQGGQVVIADHNRELGKERAKTIGKNAALFFADVSDPTSCKECVEFTLGQFGQLDYVVNSAINMSPGLLKDLELDDWNKAINVGLTGTFLMCQAAGRWMIDNGNNGAMVNLSSIGGVAPYAMSGAYSTVKAAVVMLTKHLGIEWASHGIRVNTILPGHIETPLTAYLKDPEIKKGRSDVTPLKRVGQPVDIANGILFLLSDEADYITSTALGIGGGLAVSVLNHRPGRKWD